MSRKIGLISFIAALKCAAKVIHFALNYRQKDDNNNDKSNYGIMRLLQPVRSLKTCLSFSYSDTLNTLK